MLYTENDFQEGDLILYQNGDRFEIGKIKRLTPTGAFVWYSDGDTAAKTPYETMHKIVNANTIQRTTLGGQNTSINKMVTIMKKTIVLTLMG